jgi:putative ABC transport system permease protein
MRWTDLIAFPLSTLWQQKSRTVLTTLGVVFGSFVLAASLSIGQGVQDTIDRESRRHDALRRVSVRPKWQSIAEDAGDEDEEIAGEMDDDKRDRIRRALKERKEAKRPRPRQLRLTRENIAAIAAMEHVESATPVLWQNGVATIDYQFQSVSVFSARPENDDLRKRIVAGRSFRSPDERAVVVSELVLYHCLRTDAADLERVLGTPLRLELQSAPRETGLSVNLALPDDEEMTADQKSALEKIRDRLPDALSDYELTPIELEAVQSLERRSPAVQIVTEEFPIVGVYRLLTQDEEKGHYDELRVRSDIAFPIETGMDLFFRTAGSYAGTVDSVIVVADEEQHTVAVRDRIKELGFEAHAFVEFIQRQRLMYLLIFGGMTCVAGVAMLVAALGIANTMLMSVLERTREIGIMKAVGAGNGQLVFLFLIEGALIGTFGSVCGLLLARWAAIPGDAWVRSMVSRDMQLELAETLFVFPPWLTFVVLTFAIVVTTMAAVYPARHAARIDPVAALRHE